MFKKQYILGLFISIGGLVLVAPGQAYAISSQDCKSEHAELFSMYQGADSYVVAQYEQHRKRRYEQLNGMRTKADGLSQKEALPNVREVLAEATDPLHKTFLRLNLCLTELRVQQLTGEAQGERRKK